MKPCDKEPEILFFDNHLLVLNKPSGMLTQPNHTMEFSLEAFGKQWLKTHFQKKGNVFLEAVHRLDRVASGIVLFARSQKALSRLQQAQREKRFEKSYFALVEGRLAKQQATLSHYLVHKNHKAHISNEKEPKAKQCMLKYRAVKESIEYTLLHIALETGRYHQIRAQLAAIGYPILGDLKYGSTNSFRAIALHHGHLQVPHPISRKPISWRVLLPDDWPFAFHHPPQWSSFQ
ncbi:MAG: RNA pseudouridine synthase [Chlamydiales bacterium]